jgi:hypothetical protein
MNKEEIIEHVIEKTDWEMMAALRTTACLAKDMRGGLSFLNTPESLKEIGEDLLRGMLDRDVEYSATAMLKAYKEDIGDGDVEYGIRFEAETLDAIAYVKGEENEPREV